MLGAPSAEFPIRDVGCKMTLQNLPQTRRAERNNGDHIKFLRFIYFLHLILPVFLVRLYTPAFHCAYPYPVYYFLVGERKEKVIEEATGNGVLDFIVSFSGAKSKYVCAPFATNNTVCFPGENFERSKV